MTDATEPWLQARFSGRLGAFDIDVAFEAPAQGVTALTGPSGAGKTTVLRCIAGLERLGGRLSIGGEAWQDDRGFLAPHRRPIGFVFQDAGLLEHLSVRGNLMFAQKRAPVAGRVDFAAVVEMLGLSPLLERSTLKLSGGERQRVAIGRALLTQPRLLLMDEPLSGLDAAAREEILTGLERVHRALAIPLLYVSHDLAEVRRLADRTLEIRAGRMIQAAPACDEPERQAAARKVGDMSPAAVAALAVEALLAGLKAPPTPPPK